MLQSHASHGCCVRHIHLRLTATRIGCYSRGAPPDRSTPLIRRIFFVPPRCRVLVSFEEHRRPAGAKWPFAWIRRRLYQYPLPPRSQNNPTPSDAAFSRDIVSAAHSRECAPYRHRAGANEPRTHPINTKATCDCDTHPTAGPRNLQDNRCSPSAPLPRALRTHPHSSRLS